MFEQTQRNFSQVSAKVESCWEYPADEFWTEHVVSVPEIQLERKN
jgi:hypothetical protein